MSLLIAFHQYKDRLEVKKIDGEVSIKCAIRNKYLILKPEELVRQLFIQYVINENIYTKNLIQVERGIKVNGILRRFDIVIYDHQVNPFMLVECKSHQVKITQKTLDQVSLYNLTIQAPYLLVTNGITTICSALDLKEKKYHFRNELPAISS